MMVYKIFDSQNLLFIGLQISPQIFSILQNFPINNLKDQQFCTLLCELELPVVVLFTGIALEVEVPPGMVCRHTTLGTGWAVELETKVIRRFAKISQSLC